MENNQETAQLKLSTWYKTLDLNWCPTFQDLVYMTIFVQTAAHHDYGVLFLWRNEEEV